MLTEIIYAAGCALLAPVLIFAGAELVNRILAEIGGDA